MKKYDEYLITLQSHSTDQYKSTEVVLVCAHILSGQFRAVGGLHASSPLAYLLAKVWQNGNVQQIRNRHQSEHNDQRDLYKEQQVNGVEVVHVQQEDTSSITDHDAAAGAMAAVVTAGEDGKHRRGDLLWWKARAKAKEEEKVSGQGHRQQFRTKGPEEIYNLKKENDHWEEVRQGKVKEEAAPTFRRNVQQITDETEDEEVLEEKFSALLLIIQLLRLYFLLPLLVCKPACLVTQMIPLSQSSHVLESYLLAPVEQPQGKKGGD